MYLSPEFDYWCIYLVITCQLQEITNPCPSTQQTTEKWNKLGWNKTLNTTKQPPHNPWSRDCSARAFAPAIAATVEKLEFSSFFSN